MERDDLDAALDAARAGDDIALATLFRALHPALLHYARRRAPDVAEDVVAETWLAAAKGFATFKGGAGDLRAWLFTIARRRIADHYRSRSRRPRLVTLTEAVDPPAPRSTEGEALETLSTRQAIDALVRDLPADQAEVVLLRVVAGLDVAHVAHVMGRSPGAVRVLQHRALRRLAKTWATQGVTR